MNSTTFAAHRTGAIAWALVRNPIEDPGSKGKSRPTVLIRREGSVWLVAGLTKQSHYKTTGEPRIPVAHWAEVGLQIPSYLWSTHLVRVSVLEVFDVMGFADASLAARISFSAQLSVEDDLALQRAAIEFHGAGLLS